MSIARLHKLRLVGPLALKQAVLEHLQELGCLMLVPLKTVGDAQDTAPHRKVHEALAFLLSCPRRRPQVTDASAFDAEACQKQTLELQRRLQDLEDERDEVVQRIRDLEPWGDFEFPAPEEMAGQRLWFYAVPRGEMPKLDALNLRWAEISRDDANGYVVVIDKNEPIQFPAPRVESGNLPPAALRRRRDELDQLIEDAQEDRYSLTRWCDLFIHHLNVLEDRAGREWASHQMLDAGPLFGLEAWVPRDRLADVRQCAAIHRLAIEVREPTASDEPPTLMRNRPGLDAGEGLVTFYMTPGYFTWDPSPIVLFSFAVFFAMILADAGYAALMALLLAFLWRRTGATPGGRRFRTLLTLLTLASLVFGVLVGSYFGVAPATKSLPGRLAIINITDANAMMGLSVIIGVLHLVLANVLNARRFGWKSEALAPLGWACMILGGFFVPVAGIVKLSVLRTAGIGMLIIGAVLVLAFSGVGKKPVARAVSGLLAFTRVTGAFGDVLSYLRLFALGLASASLGVAFNEMAGQLRDAVPGVGFLLMLLVLLVGHGLNMILSLSSAVIHGLRLNVIEFFNWGLPDEGKPFSTFARKERRTWTT